MHWDSEFGRKNHNIARCKCHSNFLKNVCSNCPILTYFVLHSLIIIWAQFHLKRTEQSLIKITCQVEHTGSLSARHTGTITTAAITMELFLHTRMYSAALTGWHASYWPNFLLCIIFLNVPLIRFWWNFGLSMLDVPTCLCKSFKTFGSAVFEKMRPNASSICSDCCESPITMHWEVGDFKMLVPVSARWEIWRLSYTLIFVRNPKVQNTLFSTLGVRKKTYGKKNCVQISLSWGLISSPRKNLRV